MNAHNYIISHQTEPICCGFINRPSLEISDKLIDFNLFPNPFNNSISINSKYIVKGNYNNIVVCDLYGNTLFQKSIIAQNEEQLVIDLENENLHIGLYILKLQTQNNELYFKIFKNE